MSCLQSVGEWPTITKPFGFAVFLCDVLALDYVEVRGL